jgi:hypothetical protein
MAPPATATARRAPARPAARPGPSSPRRPPLWLFEPAPRSRPRPDSRAVGRSTIWLSGLLIVGSLLAVVVGDALITEGQVRLSSVQSQVASALSNEKSLQASVAEKAAPPVVVGQAEGQGLVAPTQVVYLPRVPLDVPLPVPHTTPVLAPARAASSSSSPATSASSPAATAATPSPSQPASGSATAPTPR